MNDQMKKYEKKSDVKALLVYGAPGTYLAKHYQHLYQVIF